MVRQTQDAVWEDEDGAGGGSGDWVVDGVREGEGAGVESEVETGGFGFCVVDDDREDGIAENVIVDDEV